MSITIICGSETKNVTLESFITPSRQKIWIGKRDNAVYNTIIVDTNETFLCTISYLKAENSWRLSSGQIRTHCSRGLKSDRSRACSMCRGCCGYIHTANPDYSLRKTNATLLLNGAPIPTDGVTLKENDIITII